MNAKAPSVMEMPTWSPSPVRCARKSPASRPTTAISEPPARSATCNARDGGLPVDAGDAQDPGPAHVGEVVPGLADQRPVRAVPESEQYTIEGLAARRSS